MQSQPTGMRWEPFEPRSPNAGAGHSADAVKKAVSPGLEWRSWRTTGSQSRESFIPGPTSVSPSGTRGKSRMHKGARTDPCGRGDLGLLERHREQLASVRNVCGSVAVGEQPIVSDAMEALGHRSD